MSKLNSIADFIYAIMYDYPDNSGIKEENTIKQDVFFKKYADSLRELKNIDFDKLYELVSEQNNSAIYPPTISQIKECCKKAYKQGATDARLVSFCFKKDGQTFEYAYPRREFEAYKTTIEKIKNESDKFWFGTTHEEPA